MYGLLIASKHNTFQELFAYGLCLLCCVGVWKKLTDFTHTFQDHIIEIGETI